MAHPGLRAKKDEDILGDVLPTAKALRVHLEAHAVGTVHVVQFSFANGVRHSVFFVLSHFRYSGPRVAVLCPMAEISGDSPVVKMSEEPSGFFSWMNDATFLGNIWRLLPFAMLCKTNTFIFVSI